MTMADNEETPKENESGKEALPEGTEENTPKWLADVERAEKAAKELNEAAAKIEALQAYAKLGGETSAGQGNVKEEISDEEYAKRAIGNKL